MLCSKEIKINKRYNQNSLSVKIHLPQPLFSHREFSPWKYSCCGYVYPWDSFGHCWELHRLDEHGWLIPNINGQGTDLCNYRIWGGEQKGTDPWILIVTISLDKYQLLLKAEQKEGFIPSFHPQGAFQALAHPHGHGLVVGINHPGVLSQAS